MVDTGEALAIVDVNDLQKWRNTFTPDYTQMEDDMTIKKSPFPFNDSINSKIVYWTGDVSLLNAQAIVCCNNETFTEKNDLVTIKTLNRAGKELKQELTNEIRMCKTGDAKITKGYNLAARYIIHTVGPRYNRRYVSAAETALFSGYRAVLHMLREKELTTLGLRCIHSSYRGYPSASGAHLALRTVRRFLEKYSEDIEVIVFVVTGDDREAYSSLLPLYFPRSHQEEIYAAQRLPKDIGNSEGEPIIAERQIRISANPTKENDTILTDSSDDDGIPISETFGSDVTIGEHAFSKMEGDVDKRKLEKRKTSGNLPKANDVRKTAYERMLKRANQENLVDLSSLRFLYQSGFDKHGHPVIMFVAKNFSPTFAERARLFFVKQLDSIVSSRYVLVYVHTEAKSHPTSECLVQLFNVLDDRYKSNLHAVYMLHANVLTKLSYWWFLTFNSPELKTKVEYLEGVEHLFAKVTPDQVDLPDFVLQYDLDNVGIRYYSGSQHDDGL